MKPRVRAYALNAVEEMRVMALVGRKMGDIEVCESGRMKVLEVLRVSVVGKVEVGSVVGLVLMLELELASTVTVAGLTEHGK